MRRPRHLFVTGAAALALTALSVVAAHAKTVADPGLAPYDVENYGIVKPLTSMPGNAAAGAKVAVDRKLGNCLSCHKMPMNEPDQGNVGPDLGAVGARYSVAQLRLRIVDPKLINPQTIMPAYYRTAGLHDVLKNFAGKPILTAQQVEDLVAYLASLK